eukprot:GHVS01051623.1.p1 GENE.GHVS01051623.1~~GHVS01051623.1.p1  ORF type:complete len:120 (-),score=7.73 GHVS01051623.1:208-567(-)
MERPSCVDQFALILVDVALSTCSAFVGYGWLRRKMRAAWRSIRDRFRRKNRVREETSTFDVTPQSEKRHGWLRRKMRAVRNRFRRKNRVHAETSTSDSSPTKDDEEADVNESTPDVIAG